MTDDRQRELAGSVNQSSDVRKTDAGVSLLACPFCGNEPRMWDVAAISRSAGFTITCPQGCHVEFDCPNMTEAETAAAWNRRTAPVPQCDAEKSASDAPVWYRNDEASAWANGYNAAMETRAVPARCDAGSGEVVRSLLLQNVGGCFDSSWEGPMLMPEKVNILAQRILAALHLPVKDEAGREALRTWEEIELDALRQEIRQRLSECSEKQTAFFNKVYPDGIDKLDRDKLRNAVGLCQRTVAKNRTGEMHNRHLPSLSEQKQ